MDPVVQLALRAAFALLLGSAAAHKLADPARFRSVLEGYDVMPRSAARRLAPAVGPVEALLAALLLLGFAPAATAFAAASLMLVYAAAIARNVARGRTGIDCGCTGAAARTPLGPGLVARNVLLAASAGVLAVPVASRGLVWLDALAVAFAVAALSACWLASERMLALAPRAAALRRPRS